ncbi:MAG: hypothetical protein DRP96_04075 [Candidatus Neomarinimicrobiota bacterium]|nr:MAG: hypothetical protein DRP96_04075 [Candidatus Neomarinimicrobiota bacterium]
MKQMKRLILPGLIAVFCIVSLAQVGVPEIFPFSKENTVLIKTAGGFNFDNDEFLDIIGIAAQVDNKALVIPRTTYLVHLEESINKDFIVQWKYPIPENLKADFTDVCVTDMDGDALPEIVAALNISDVGNSKQPAWLYSFEYIDGFPAKPTALLGQTSALITRPRPMYLHAGDWNGDNNPDIIVSSGGPGRSIIIVSSNGQVDTDNLDIIYQAHNLPALQGILSFRAILANTNPKQGKELAVFGGKDNLMLEVYGHQNRNVLNSLIFPDVKRSDADLEHLIVADVDGDGFDEFIISRKSGAAVLITFQDGKLVSAPFLLPTEKVSAIMAADLNNNSLTEVFYSNVDNTAIFQIEYDLSDILTDPSSYRLLQYDHPMLKGFDYIDIKAVVSSTGKYTGSIIMPFLSKNLNKHGLCLWQLEDMARFFEEGPIDEVLDEVDQALEAKAPAEEEPVPVVTADDLIGELANLSGDEVPLSPMPSTKTGMISTKSISEVFRPDILVHPGEKVSRRITIEDLTLNDLVDLDVNVKMPAGMKFDLQNKIFTWFPADSQLGLHRIRADFIWGNNHVIKSFTVYVNDPPKITTVTPERDIIQIGETFNLNITVADSNENPFLGYKMVNYPDGAGITADGLLSWKPSFDQKDWYDFLIEVSDGYDTDQIGFSLFVNHPVDIASAANPQTTIGAHYRYRPIIEDKNDGFFVYWYDKSPRITDWKKSGIYETKIIDESVRTNLEKYIERYKREFIPEFDPARNIKKRNMIDDVFLYEGKLVFVFNILGKKAPEAGDVIRTFFGDLGLSTPKYSKPERRYFYTFTPKEMPNGMTMNEEGAVNWIPAQNQFDYHSLSYTVSDGYFTAEEHAQIYVNAVPVIVSSPDTNAYVNSLWEYEIKVTDLNTDSKLSYELTKAPDGMLISPRGIISWTPTEMQLNTNGFAFKVSDGMASDEQSGHVFVNIKPKILSVPKPVALTGLKWEYTLDAEDPNGDPLIMKAVRIPKGAKFDPATGELVWSPKKSQRGVNDIVLEVVDSHGWSTLQEFQVHVFHNPGTQRLNFLRNTISLLALIGIIYLVAIK